MNHAPHKRKKKIKMAVTKPEKYLSECIVLGKQLRYFAAAIFDLTHPVRLFRFLVSPSSIIIIIIIITIIIRDTDIAYHCLWTPMCDYASVTFEVSDVSAAMTIPDSQFRCIVASCPVGATVGEDAVHISKLAWNDGSGEATDRDRSVWDNTSVRSHRDWNFWLFQPNWFRVHHWTRKSSRTFNWR